MTAGIMNAFIAAPQFKAVASNFGQKPLYNSVFILRHNQCGFILTLKCNNCFFEMINFNYLKRRSCAKTERK